MFTIDDGGAVSGCWRGAKCVILKRRRDIFLQIGLLSSINVSGVKTLMEVELRPEGTELVFIRT